MQKPPCIIQIPDIKGEVNMEQKDVRSLLFDF